MFIRNFVIGLLAIAASAATAQERAPQTMKPGQERPVYDASSRGAPEMRRADPETAGTLQMTGAPTAEQFMAIVRQGVGAKSLPGACYRFNVALADLPKAEGQRATETLPRAFTMAQGGAMSVVDATKPVGGSGTSVCIRSGCVQDCPKDGPTCRMTCTVTCGAPNAVKSAGDLSREALGTLKESTPACQLLSFAK